MKWPTKKTQWTSRSRSIWIITFVTVFAHGLCRVLWKRALTRLMTLVTVQCKYNSDERRRTYPQLWHVCLVFLGQSLAKWPVSPHFLHSTPSAERGSGQSGLWCPGSVCCQIHSICDLIGRTYVCSYDTRLGRGAHLGNRGHDVPL